jgi:hypothetical protein
MVGQAWHGMGADLEDVARDHQLVARVNADGRADLVLPLAGHHLREGGEGGK